MEDLGIEIKCINYFIFIGVREGNGELGFDDCVKIIIFLV